MKPTPAQIEAAATRINWIKQWVDPIEVATKALTAAAEVGELVDLMIKDAVDAAIAATIERCAQVAENYLRPICYVEREHPVRNEIAAAIRALKDKP